MIPTFTFLVSYRPEPPVDPRLVFLQQWIRATIPPPLTRQEEIQGMVLGLVVSLAIVAGVLLFAYR